MRWALVLDDEVGSGYGVCLWLQANQYACSLLPGYAEAEAEIPLRQAESDGPVLVVASLTPMGVAFLAAMAAAHPPLATAAHTREAGRDHAGMIAHHRLQMVVQVGADGTVVGVEAGLPPDAAPAAAPSARIPRQIAQPPPPPPELPPLAGAPPTHAEQRNPTPSPFTAAELAPELRAEPTPTSEHPARGTGRVDLGLAGGAHTEPPPRPTATIRKEVQPIWITVIDDGTGCSRVLIDNLAVPAVVVTTAIGWRAATELASSAVSAGLVVGPMSAEAIRCCRKIASVARGSQTVMYTDPGMTPHQQALFRESHGLQVVRKPLKVEDFRTIIEHMRLPANQGAAAQAPLPEIVPTQRTSRPDTRSPLYRTPLPESSRFSARPQAPGAQPQPQPQPQQPQPETGSTVRVRSDLRTPPPRMPVPPAAPPTAPVQSPLSGIAAIRARRQAERGARMCSICGVELPPEPATATICAKCSYTGRTRKPG